MGSMRKYRLHTPHIMSNAAISTGAAGCVICLLYIIAASSHKQGSLGSMVHLKAWRLFLEHVGLDGGLSNMCFHACL